MAAPSGHTVLTALKSLQVKLQELQEERDNRSHELNEAVRTLEKYKSEIDRRERFKSETETFVETIKVQHECLTDAARREAEIHRKLSGDFQVQIEELQREISVLKGNYTNVCSQLQHQRSQHANASHVMQTLQAERDHLAHLANALCKVGSRPSKPKRDESRRASMTRRDPLRPLLAVTNAAIESRRGVPRTRRRSLSSRRRSMSPPVRPTASFLLQATHPQVFLSHNAYLAPSSNVANHAVENDALRDPSRTGNFPCVPSFETVCPDRRASQSSGAGLRGVPFVPCGSSLTFNTTAQYSQDRRESIDVPASLIDRFQNPPHQSVRQDTHQFCILQCNQLYTILEAEFDELNNQYNKVIASAAYIDPTTLASQLESLQAQMQVKADQLRQLKTLRSTLKEILEPGNQ